MPVPDTVRDAVLVGARELSAEARAAAEAAAVAGEDFDLELVGELSSADGLAELIERGLRRRARPGAGAFRHALTREALYADVPWLGAATSTAAWPRRSRQAAAPSIEIATHWLGAREEARAREALLRAAAESAAVHAYRDAARAARQALELWPEARRRTRALEALERYARSAELVRRAGRGGARVARDLRRLRARRRPARAARRPSAGSPRIYELQGDRDGRFAARRAAAEAYAAGGRPAEAAVERLAMANYLRASASYSRRDRARRAPPPSDAERAGGSTCACAPSASRAWRRPRAATSRAGSRSCASGLALALEHDLTAVAAELYQRLSLVLYDCRRLPRGARRRSTPRSRSAAPATTPAPRSPA